jgi:hypothetical protein
LCYRLNPWPPAFQICALSLSYMPSPCPFLKSPCHFLVAFKSSLYILGINYLSNRCMANTFSPLAWGFTLLRRIPLNSNWSFL